jgi:hypothetical protein
VVIGTADRLTPPVHARRLVEALPHAELVELHGAGQQAPLEDPAAFNAVLRRRLADAPSPSAASTAAASSSAAARSATPQPAPA